ncbi:MAG: amidohydrolase family protein [Candidatus Tectomicrobia bacterium]|nr:amidohydrolase family protein [Candidatus Tectomicrobia bacterium]
MFDALIRRARLRDGSSCDIGIASGAISAIAPSIAGTSHLELDAGGRLVTPAYVDPHVHLDKALLAEAMPARERGTFQEAIDATLEARRGYKTEEVFGRASQVVELAVRYGTTAMRGFVDVGPVGGLVPLEAVLRVKERYADLIDIQVVPFPQEGLIRNPGAEELLVEAMEMGGDVVGGFPWFELSGVYAQEHIDRVFRIARRFDADIHMLVDDEPLAPHCRNIEQLALKTLAEGYQGRVAVSHACGLASYDEFSAERIIRLVKEADISVCCNAHVSLVSKCEHAPEPRPRGITRVRDLLEAGVNVTCAQDDVSDPYYPFGRADMLEVGSFLAHAAHLHRPGQLQTAYDAITVNAARALRLEGYGLEVGCRADLVILEEAETVAQAFRLQPGRRYVIRRGRVAAESLTQTRLHRLT